MQFDEIHTYDTHLIERIVGTIPADDAAVVRARRRHDERERRRMTPRVAYPSTVGRTRGLGAWRT